MTESPYVPPLHVASAAGLLNGYFGPNGPVYGVADLLANGVSANEPDLFGRTALMIAAHHGQVESLKHLLSKNANVHAETYRNYSSKPIAGGETALFAAASAQHPNLNHALIVELLTIAGASVHAQSADGSTALHACARHGNLLVAHELVLHGAIVNSRDMFGSTALHKSANLKDPSLFDLLVKAGADREARDSKNRTADDIRSHPDETEERSLIEHPRRTMSRVVGFDPLSLPQKDGPRLVPGSTQYSRAS